MYTQPTNNKAGSTAAPGQVSLQRPIKMRGRGELLCPEAFRSMFRIESGSEWIPTFDPANRQLIFKEVSRK